MKRFVFQPDHRNVSFETGHERVLILKDGGSETKRANSYKRRHCAIARRDVIISITASASTLGLHIFTMRRRLAES